MGPDVLLYLFNPRLDIFGHRRGCCPPLNAEANVYFTAASRGQDSSNFAGMAPANALSDDQLRTLALVERVASALSIIGVLTIITAFAASKQFRNPIHRLIFINAFYNALDIAATMISLSGPSAGDGSPLCQFQGFLLQMFPVADVLWTFVMAVDVYLIVFRRYDAKSLRKLETRYTTVITAVSFLPAFVFLFIRSPEKGPMYGSVSLWCAIAPNWVAVRVYAYYIPIW